MFKSKPMIFAIFILGSILFQQPIKAYPRASQESELNFLKSILQAYYSQSIPELDLYIEEQYKNRSHLLQNALTAGYEMCNDIQLSNDKGISGQTLLEKEISKHTGRTLQATGTTVTEEHMVTMYENVTYYLCPEVF